MHKEKSKTNITISSRILNTLAISLLVLSACEATLRLSNFSPRYAVKLAGKEREIGSLSIELDRNRLFRLLPDASVGINSRGFRDAEDIVGSPSNSDSEKQCKRIAVLGDSIVMGMAVRSEETLAKQLAKYSNHTVCGFNYGIQGYGPDQSLRVLEEDVIKTQPDLVVLVLYPENDFSDLIRNQLVEVTANGELTWNDNNIVSQRLPRWRLQTLIRLAFTGHFLPLDQEADLDEVLFRDRGEVLVDSSTPPAIAARKLLYAVLVSFKQQLNRAQIPFLVVVVTGMRAVDAAQRDHKELGILAPEFANEQLTNGVIAELGLPTLDLTSQFLTSNSSDLYDKNDMHLSVGGHQLAARAIAERVASQLQK